MSPGGRCSGAAADTGHEATRSRSSWASRLYSSPRRAPSPRLPARPRPRASASADCRSATRSASHSRRSRSGLAVTLDAGATEDHDLVISNHTADLRLTIKLTATDATGNLGPRPRSGSRSATTRCNSTRTPATTVRDDGRGSARHATRLDADPHRRAPSRPRSPRRRKSRRGHRDADVPGLDHRQRNADRANRDRRRASRRPGSHTSLRSCCATSRTRREGRAARARQRSASADADVQDRPRRRRDTTVNLPLERATGRYRPPRSRSISIRQQCRVVVVAARRTADRSFAADAPTRRRPTRHRADAQASSTGVVREVETVVEAAVRDRSRDPRLLGAGWFICEMRARTRRDEEEMAVRHRG